LSLSRSNKGLGTSMILCTCLFQSVEDLGTSMILCVLRFNYEYVLDVGENGVHIFHNLTQSGERPPASSPVEFATLVFFWKNLTGPSDTHRHTPKIFFIRAIPLRLACRAEAIVA
jgi:hypothetical protein